MTWIKKGVPEARRQQILDWLEEEDSLSIRELEGRLNISHMTVHRDLDKLTEQNLIRKVRGGAILAQKLEEQHKIQHTCAMCDRRISRRSEFIIMRKGGGSSECLLPPLRHFAALG